MSAQCSQSSIPSEPHSQSWSRISPSPQSVKIRRNSTRKAHIGLGGHRRALDGLRALSILAVVAFHLIPELAPGGALGVDVFFTLSSFLITSLIWEEVAESGGFSGTSFYLRRAFRLLPALFIMLLLLAPITCLATGEPGIGVGIFIGATYLTGMATAGLFDLPQSPMPFWHLWSLAIEEQFYVLWPWVAVALYRAGRRNLGWMYAAVIIGCVALETISVAVLGGSRTYFMPNGHLAALMAGAGCAYIASKSHGAIVNIALRKSAGNAMPLVIGVAMIVAPSAIGEMLYHSAKLVPTLATCLLILHVIFGKSLALVLLESGLMGWIGQRSYGIYLYHTTLYHVFSPQYLPLSRSASGLLGLAVAIVISDLSFRFIESPLRRRGRSLARRFSPVVVADRLVPVGKGV